MCGSLLRYRRSGRAGMCLDCSAQQSDLILQFCNLVRLRVELCAQETDLETVEPVGVRTSQPQPRLRRRGVKEHREHAGFVIEHPILRVTTRQRSKNRLSQVCTGGGY